MPFSSDLNQFNALSEHSLKRVAGLILISYMLLLIAPSKGPVINYREGDNKTELGRLSFTPTKTRVAKRCIPAEGGAKHLHPFKGRHKMSPLFLPVNRLGKRLENKHVAI